MRKPVRLSILVAGVIVALLSLQIDVAAKKKRTRKKSARNAAVVVVPPVFTSPADDVFVNGASASVRRTTPAAGSVHIEGQGGDSGTGGKRSRGRVTLGPSTPETVTAGTLLISEFRVRGPNGANDEFIEIYNNSGADHTVTAISGTGYGLYASDAVIRCLIPNGTVIPAKGHFLCANVGYSYAAYPAGNGTTASGDATYATDIPDNKGVALFNNNTGALTLANRFDAAGSTSEADSLYREGAGLATLTPFSIEYSWVRDECGKGGTVNLLGPCTISTPKDTDDNAADFYFVDTNGTNAGGGQRLGGPGPENMTSPIQRNASISALLLDATVASSSAPNRVRDFTSDPGNNSTFGTLSIRRRFVNNTGANITRLRFRIIDTDTFPAASGFADLRARTSLSVVVAGINDAATCTAAGQATPCSITVEGTTLEQDSSAPSTGQPNGGAFNSSLGAGTITLGTPLVNGGSIDVQFLLGIQGTGNFRIYVNMEALP